MIATFPHMGGSLMARQFKGLCLFIVFHVFIFNFSSANSSSLTGNQCGLLFDSGLIEATIAEIPFAQQLHRDLHNRWIHFLDAKEWVQAYQVPIQSLHKDLLDLRILLMQIQDLTTASKIRNGHNIPNSSYRNLSSKSQNYVRNLKLVTLPVQIQKVHQSLSFIQNHSAHFLKAYESARDLEPLALAWLNDEQTPEKMKTMAGIYLQFSNIPFLADQIQQLTKSQDWESIMAPIASLLGSTTKKTLSFKNHPTASSEWSLDFSHSSRATRPLEIPVWETTQNHVHYLLSQGMTEQDHPLLFTVSSDSLFDLAAMEQLPGPQFRRRLGPTPFEPVKDQIGSDRIKASLHGNILNLEIRFESDLTSRILHIDWISGQVTNPSGGRPFFKVTP